MNDTVILPLSPLEAFKLYLMNLPYFHKRQSLNETKEMLKDNGDYLIQVFDFLILSFRI